MAGAVKSRSRYRVVECVRKLIDCAAAVWGGVARWGLPVAENKKPTGQLISGGGSLKPYQAAILDREPPCARTHARLGTATTGRAQSVHWQAQTHVLTIRENPQNSNSRVEQPFVAVSP